MRTYETVTIVKPQLQSPAELCKNLGRHHETQRKSVALHGYVGQ